MYEALNNDNYCGLWKLPFSSKNNVGFVDNILSSSKDISDFYELFSIGYVCDVYKCHVSETIRDATNTH